MLLSRDSIRNIRKHILIACCRSSSYVLIIGLEAYHLLRHPWVSLREVYSHIRGCLGRTVLVWVRPLRKVYDQTDAVNDPKKGLNRRMWLSQDIAHKIPLSSTVDEHYGFYARGRDKRPEKLQIPAIARTF